MDGTSVVTTESAGNVDGTANLLGTANVLGIGRKTGTENDVEE